MNETIRSLVDEFVSSVIKQHECMLEGNHEAGNKYAKLYIDCWNKIHALGPDAKDEMSKLFKHEIVAVRATAANFLLRHKTAEALKVLREIAKESGLNAFGASESILRWEEGYWHLDD